jgi:pentatricopeptide repeat protein
MKRSKSHSPSLIPPIATPIYNNSCFFSKHQQSISRYSGGPPAGGSYAPQPSEGRYGPDHGERFLPGTEDRHVPTNMAPEPLDHFKRGYQDRAVERERERSDDRRFTDSTGGPYGGGGGGRGSYPPRRNSYEGGGGRGRGGRGGGSGSFRRSGGGDGSFYGDGRRSSNFGGDREDRGLAGRGPTIIMGLDIGALVDRLVRPGCDVFRELDETRENNKAVFQSGKAVTAIISNLARRRNLRIANAVWDWIDSIGIDKNTFHYNSMISVCEKVRDYNKALRLLDEMSEKKVAKNEVTFSSAISACEKCGQWRNALDLLEQMVRVRSGMTGQGGSTGWFLCIVLLM